MTTQQGGGGRGRGRRGGQGMHMNPETMKNLDQAAEDIQKMIEELKMSGQPNKPAKNSGQPKRGSQSTQDLSSGMSPAHQPRGGYRGGQRGGTRGGQRGGYQGGQRGGYQGGQRGGYQGGYQGGQQRGRGGHQHFPVPLPNLMDQGYHHPPNMLPQEHYDAPPPYEMSRTPPPSYYASCGGAVNQPDYKSGKKEQGGLKPQDVVKALARFNKQWAPMQQLSRQVDCDMVEVEKVVRSNKNIFAFMKSGNDMVIELVPKISLCSEYLSEGGCTSRDSCMSLHMCKTYVTDRCPLDASSCQFGHRFDTNHNTAILSKFYLDLIEKDTLRYVVKKVCKEDSSTSSLKICRFYNSKQGCKYRDKCSNLHMCQEFVTSAGNCKTQSCPYNHDPKSCKGLLGRHGISTNESIRDILVSLQSIFLAEEKVSRMAKKSKQGNETGKKVNDASDDSSDENSDSDGKKETKSAKKTRRKDKAQKGTVFSTDIYGEVEIPEICTFSVNHKCMNEKKGCKYLHAGSLFHWQVHKDGKWFNLRIYQSKALENAYRDVSQSGTTIPPLDPQKITDGSDEQKMLRVMGKSTWKADFQNFTICNPSGVKLAVRRIATQSSVVSKSPKATVYEWYFQDEQGKWICYGQVDSLGKQDFVCTITCEDIEKQFLADPTSSLVICSAHYKYRLEFTTMTQTNLSTQRVREVRRRPARLSYQRPSSVQEDKTLPSHWLSMPAGQTHILVAVDPSQDEFQDVAGRLRLTIPTANVVKIQRLQNEYLWRLMQYKKAELSQRYNDVQLNVQKLFHGTTMEMIDTICKENIDGRLYSTKKHDYGKGTSFSNSGAVARSYCTVNNKGHFFLVLAEVIIGSIVKGHKTITRPPINPATGSLYDTTVDNVHAPTIFVKYDKEEYFPHYIIEFF